MKLQQISNFALPLYMRVEMCNSGFTVFVTRRISTKHVEPIAHMIDRCLPTVKMMTVNGRHYVGWKKFYTWDRGNHPASINVLQEAKEAHCRIMGLILDCKIQDLESKYNFYMSEAQDVNW